MSKVLVLDTLDTRHNIVVYVEDKNFVSTMVFLPEDYYEKYTFVDSLKEKYFLVKRVIMKHLLNLKNNLEFVKIVI